jgi:hypothetical protein
MKIGDRVVADQAAMRRSCEQVPDDPAGQIVSTDEEFFVVRFDEDTADDALFLKSELRPLLA